MQDAYSLRCIPQVHGAIRDALAYAGNAISTEMSSATDNPMVFAETGELLSGGNFHGQPVALAADVMAIAMAELGAIAERRIERLVNPALSDLPAFLTPEGGVKSGLMIAHVTAAALASEVRDPMRPPAGAALAAVPTQTQWSLYSTAVSAGRRSAIVNGQVVSEGSVVDGARVLRIQPSSVRLATADGEITLRLPVTDIKQSAR